MKDNLVPLVFIWFLFSSCASMSNSSKSETVISLDPASNIQRVRTYWSEVWEKGNLQGVADFYHPNAKHGDDFTIEGFQKGVTSQREAIPNLKVKINDIFAAGDKVITEVTYVGTHTGRRFFGQDPLSKEINLPGIDIFTFKDGKCISHQHVADHLPMVRQIGLKLVPTRDSVTGEKEILKASQNYLDLMKKLYSGKNHDELLKNGDVESFNKTLADEYTYTDPKGVIHSKQDELSFIKNNAIILQSAEVKHQKVRVDGNTAIETGVLHYKYLENGKPVDFSKRYTTTWIWRGGRWQILADHASKIVE